MFRGKNNLCKWVVICTLELIDPVQKQKRSLYSQNNVYAWINIISAKHEQNVKVNYIIDIFIYLWQLSVMNW